MDRSVPAHRYLLLGLPALLYGFAARARLLLYSSGMLRSHKLQSCVISIGNLTVGGTGKTPFVELTAKLLRDMGQKVVVLSRGYRRSSRSRITWVSDGTKLLAGWEESGDEPYMLARNLPGVAVVVGKDRASCARAAESELGSCVFVLDDGYQHLSLRRDLDVLLIDATDAFGGGSFLPLGRLREPISQVRRASLIAVTRCDRPFDDDKLKATVRRYNRNIDFLYAYCEPLGLARIGEAGKRDKGTPDGRDLIDVRQLSGGRVVAVAGIARPDLFFSDLESYGVGLARKFTFPDHYNYEQDDIDMMISAALESRADAIVTTEKDAVRMLSLDLPQRIPFYFLRIEARLKDEGKYKSYLERAAGALR